ncbi:MAG TPA: metallophosphoesterase family protein [Chloroflexota bacterium]|nr:metallophosphoesterase family protein [Chloroflexota bacterium]
MRLAIIADVHGNLAALNAVLEDIQRLEQPVETTVSAGDLVGHSAHPNEVIEALRAHKVQGVRGNYDEAVSGLRSEPGADYGTEQEAAADQQAVRWTADQLTPENAEYLRNLPREARIAVSGGGRVSVKARKDDERVSEFRRSFFLGGILGGMARSPGERLGSRSASKKERPARMGDVVTMSLYGQVEGREVFGQENIQFRLLEDDDPAADQRPETKRFPGLSRELVGIRSGEVRTVMLTLPTDYEPHELAGKTLELRAEATTVEVSVPPSLLKPKRVLLVHASPRDTVEYIYPGTAQSILRAIAENADADIIVFGHAHRASQQIAGSTAFIGVGSVGRSPVPGQAEYAILEVLGSEIQVEFRSVEYDVESEARAIESTTLPAVLAEALRRPAVAS